MATIKYSRQRESILRFLKGRTDHPTADVIYENIRLVYPNISLGTVYRNLSLLADLGQIRKLPGDSGADHFDARTEPHCHFVCTRCQKIFDMEPFYTETLCTSPLFRQVSDGFPGKITGCNISFSGICQNCLPEEEMKNEMTDKMTDKTS